MVMGAPLEDARHLAQRYDRMRQEAEAQVPVNLCFTLLYIFHLSPAYFLVNVGISKYFIDDFFLCTL